MTDDRTWSEYDFTKIPFDDLVSVGQRTLLYRDIFTVSWLLGRFCNYRCSYCWPYARSNTKDHRPTELCLSTIDEIKRQARENGFNSFHFSLSGGEPTFHPGYLDIMKHLADDVHNTNYTSVHMTSNCSRPMKWFEEYVEKVKPFHRANITASLHTEHLNTPAKLQGFADKLIMCQLNDVQVTINMVMRPEHFDEDWDNALFFHNQNINVTLKPQSDPTASKVVDGYSADMLQRLYNGMPQLKYTEEKREWNGRPKPDYRVNPDDEYFKANQKIPWPMQVEFRDNAGKTWYMDQAERFNAFNFNKFEGWTCGAGHRGIIIREPDGSIKRSYSCADVPLGNIETGFKLFDKPMPCISKSCVSSADSKIPKRKPGVQVPLFPGDESWKDE
jgi:organic radical activating enzyme